MSAVNIDEEQDRWMHGSKAFKCTCNLDSLLPITLDGKKRTKYYHEFKRKLAFLGQLCAYGEAGVVKLHNKMDPKMKNRGVTCMMVGYAWKHT